jgi:diaminopimelate decarboxylase
MGSRHFVLIDAGFNDLMRPAMYGSYHHISALAGDGRSLEHAPQRETVVAGPLCESGDVFTQQEGGNVETRLLPAVVPGDYLVLHDTGRTARLCRQTTIAVLCCRRFCSITAWRG